MIFYNQITELISSQFLIIASFELLVVIIAVFVFKRKLTVKICLSSIVITFVLSLLSIIVARGNYGGMAYHESFGWPFQFYTVSRNIDNPIPYVFRLDLLKFIANTLFWGFIPLIVLTRIFTKPDDKRYNLFTTFSLIAFILLTLVFSYYNFKVERNLVIEENSSVVLLPPKNNIDKERISIKRYIIELEYPEFKDFENQKSFAGRSIKTEIADNEYYFAYIVFGSGLPIAKATCFRTDSVRAYKVGEFPDPADSYIGYRDIDPKTCKGIK